MNKDELLASIRRERQVLEAIVAQLSDAELSAAGADGRWAVKDHLSHIATWERMIVAHLRDGSDHKIAEMDRASYAAATLDELNDRLYRLYCDWPVARVRDEFAAAHGAIVAYVEQMADDRLAQPYWDDYAPERTALDKIAGDTYLHYREHAGWISELV